MSDKRVARASANTPLLGRWIKERRRSLDLTQESLAGQVGCSESTVRKIEAGLLRPSRQVAELLAGALAIPGEQRDDFVRLARSTTSAEPPAAETAPPRAGALHRRQPAGVGSFTAGSGGEIPVPPTALIGRGGELEMACALLGTAGTRLVTLTGPPGSGKTRLAIQIAAEMESSFADGARFIPLAAVRDPELVVPAIARALGAPEHADAGSFDGLRQALRYRRILLALDNFEQVIAAAGLLADLLAAAPGLKLLITSREELRLRGEKLLPVPPLELPAMDPLPPLSELARVPSVALFLARAGDSRAGFELTDENSQVIAAICHRLEGLPLAVELAAARASLLPVAFLLDRLEHLLPLLTDGPRDLPPRQRTLRSAIAWSYDLLAPAERELLQLLAVFAGGCRLDALAALRGEVEEARAAEPADLLAALDSLRGKSLLYVEVAGGEPRFHLLEMIREFALEQLGAGGAEPRVRRAHADYFLALAERAGPHLAGPRQREWLATLDREHANMRAALRLLLEQGLMENAGRLVAALARFWSVRGYWSEGRHWLETLLNRPDGITATLRARLLQRAGMLAYRQGDYEQARRKLRDSEALWRQTGSRAGLAGVLHDLGALAVLRDEYSSATRLLRECLLLQRAEGNSHGAAGTLLYLGYRAYAQGDYLEAGRHLQEGMRIFAALGDESGTSGARHHLARVAFHQGQYERAEELHAMNLAFALELGDKGGVATTLSQLGLVALARGDTGRARALIEESLARFRTLGGSIETAITLSMVGLVALHEGDYRQALACCRESLQLLRRQGAPFDIAANLVLLSAAWATQGNLERAAGLGGAAQNLIARYGMSMDPLIRAMQAQALEQARSGLGEAAFQAAWSRGGAAPVESACLDALSDFGVGAGVLP